MEPKTITRLLKDRLILEMLLNEMTNVAVADVPGFRCPLPIGRCVPTATARFGESAIIADAITDLTSPEVRERVELLFRAAIQCNGVFIAAVRPNDAFAAQQVLSNISEDSGSGFIWSFVL